MKYNDITENKNKYSAFCLMSKISETQIYSSPPPPSLIIRKVWEAEENVMQRVR